MSLLLKWYKNIHLSLIRNDSDPSDLGSLILIQMIPMEHTQQIANSEILISLIMPYQMKLECLIGYILELEDMELTL